MERSFAAMTRLKSCLVGGGAAMTTPVEFDVSRISTRPGLNLGSRKIFARSRMDRTRFIQRKQLSRGLWACAWSALVCLAAASEGSAADLSIPVKALPLAPAYDWSGFYVGGHIGYAFGNSNWAESG